MSSIWKTIIAVYFITYVVTLPWNIWLRNYRDHVLNNSVNKVLNYVFVIHYGYAWFTLVYMLHVVYGYYIGPSRTTASDQGIRALKVYGVNTAFVIFTNIWLFGPCLFERIDMACGGYCEQMSGGTVPMSPYKCVEDPNNLWVSVLDVSGHYYILLSMSFLVWDQMLKGHLSQAREIVDLELQALQLAQATSSTSSTSPASSTTWYTLSSTQVVLLKRVVQVLSAALLFIWYTEYLVTSLFFHTALEKLFGMMFALLVPLWSHGW